MNRQPQSCIGQRAYPSLPHLDGFPGSFDPQALLPRHWSKMLHLSALP